MDKNGNTRHPLLRVLQGVVIGSGAILPGISGGVLAVSFGIYQPMMELLAHPVKSFGRLYKLFIPILIGWALGFVLFARLIELLFGASMVLAVSLFIGLIAGTFPGLWKESGREGRGKQALWGFVCCFVFMMAFYLLLGSRGEALHIAPSAGWYVFCGVLWGLSLVIPGMTSSSTLIFMGLYAPMTSGIAALDMGVILPMTAGLAATVLLLARVINRLFEKRYALAYHGVLGFTLASTLVIVPREFAGVGQAVACLALAVAGFFLAWGSERVGGAKK